MVAPPALTRDTVPIHFAVRDDDGKTAVVSQRGAGAALGLSARGQSFIRFVSGKTIAPFHGVEARAKTENPLKYQWVALGAEKQPPGEFNAGSECESVTPR